MNFIYGLGWSYFDRRDEGMGQGYILDPKKFDVSDRGV